MPIRVLALLLALGMTWGCTHTRDTTRPLLHKPPCEACARGKAGGTIWCQTCKLGYVDGKKTANCCDYAQLSSGEQCAAHGQKTDGD